MEDISPQLLPPLHVCSRLRVMLIAMGGSVETTDGDIAQLTFHFPQLQDLKVKGIVGGLPNLQALAIIVTSCPMIQTIGLEMDTSRAQLPSKSSSQASVSLRRVDVQRSVASDLRPRSPVSRCIVHLEVLRAHARAWGERTRQGME